METIENIAKSAKNAFLTTMSLSDATKNEAIKNIIKKIKEKESEIFEANEKDLKEAQKLLEEGKINKPAYDRLKLDKNKLQSLIQGLEDLIKLKDPVNCVLWEKELDKGLILKKVSTPIGVIGVIFESRPDCFIQIASLIIKSGNCAILKGGSEAINTNSIFSKIVDEALDETEGFDKNAINLVYSREDIKKLLELDNYLSLIIPRGSNSLVKFIKENTKIPVLGHASGICHIFVDKTADLNNSISIITDAKTQYPSACNAVETLLIHKDFSEIEKLKSALIEKGIKIIENPDNYSIEYGDKILALKIVDNIDCAINHINKYGSGHTDSILSNDKSSIECFFNLVDSSSVLSNCSTRFSDGFRYGFGAEVGISTNKTHARGPVGLEGLTIYKYKLEGSNNIVLDYVEGKKTFTHRVL